MKRRAQAIILSTSLLFSTLFITAQTETITVIGDQPMDTSTAFMQGFINGGASYNIPMTQELKPSSWGFGWDVLADYDYAVPNFSLNKKMVSIYSAYMSYFGIGDPLLLQPWTDGYAQWDAFVNNTVNLSISTSRPVDYWSVWGEPDASFSGTPAQYIDLFKRTDSIIHAVDPSAKMVGPDLIHFGINQLIDFIDTLHLFNIHPAAISWHEFGDNPEYIYDHVDQFRDSLVSRPWLPDPEIHIQEYGDPDNRLIPGWAVGWLHYFEKSKIDWASRGCFNEYDGVNTWDDCWDGLSGMYMSDGITPQPLYWVHRAYADLNPNGRIETQSTQPRTVGMASKNDVTEEMKIIVGRYDNIYQGFPNAPANVQVKIRHYPYGNNSTQPILIQRIPAQSVAYSTPLLSPVTVSLGTINFTGDSATINLNSFGDGDTYVIYINADSSNILHGVVIDPIENDIILYPNPVSNHMMITTASTIQQIHILDVQGKIVYKDATGFTGTHELTLESLAKGVYMLEAIDEMGNKSVKKFIKN